jgi:hypothetical protein
VERIADASGEATRSGGVLPDDLPRDVAFWPILLQNSKVAGPQIFRKKTEREVIADSYNLNRITKVACEFVARR